MLATLTLAASPSRAEAAVSVAQGGGRAQPRGGAVAIDRQAHLAYIADADNAALHRVDLSSGDVATTPLACAPQEVLLVAEDRVAVSLRGCGKVQLLELNAAGDAEEIASAPVPAEPWGLAVTPAGTLLVTSAWGRALTALDAETLSPRFTLDLPREPRAVAVSPDGGRAFVTHAVGDALSVVDLPPAAGAEGPALRRVHGLTGGYRNRLDHTLGAGTLHPTSSLAYALAFNEEGTRLFIPHLLVQNGEETTRFVPGGYGGVSIQEDTSFASVAVIGVEGEQALGGAAPKGKTPPGRPIQIGSSFSDTTIAPAGSPARQARGAAVLGDALYVVSQGTGELCELDARSLDPALTVRRAFEVGEGPTGVDVDPATQIAVVWSQGAHELSVVSLGSGDVERLAIAGDPLDPELARGRRLFHAERDRRISRDGRACASCHPEGRDDGLVWRLGDGPRRTLMLAGRLEHGPFGWNGVHERLEDNIRETITRLGGGGLPEEELRALAAWLQRGLAAPSPAAGGAAGSDGESVAARGREVFLSEGTGCGGCHTLDRGGGDGKRHDIGSAAKGETQRELRTPPLRHLAGAGSYFHDGRYATLEQLLDDNLDRMGTTSHLSGGDRAALLAFLRTL